MILHLKINLNLAKVASVFPACAIHRAVFKICTKDYWLHSTKASDGFSTKGCDHERKQNQLHCIMLFDRQPHSKATHCRADVVFHVTTLMKYSARNNSDTQGPTGFGYSQIILGEAQARALPARSLVLFPRYTCQHIHTQRRPIHYKWGTLINNPDLTSFILTDSLAGSEWRRSKAVFLHMTQGGGGQR